MLFYIAGNPKSPLVIRIVGRCYRTVSRPYMLGVVVPSATTRHTVQSCFRSDWGGLPSVRISSINIPAPFADVTVHIIQSPRIRLELIHANRLPSIGSASFTFDIRVTAVPVRLFYRNITSGAERRRCSRTAGIFPFGFGRQAITFASRFQMTSVPSIVYAGVSSSRRLKALQ